MLRNRHFSIFYQEFFALWEATDSFKGDSLTPIIQMYMHTHTHKDFRFSQSKISLPRFQAPEIDNGESTEFYVDPLLLFFF